MIIYKGYRVGRAGRLRVFRDGKDLAPNLSREIYNHSSEFEWGYSGSGPAQLALALLLDATRDNNGKPEVWISVKLHQAFKQQFVASWGDEWSITDREILNWINTREHPGQDKIEEMESLTGRPSGIGRITRGECPSKETRPMACMFCPYGHLLHCHHPYTCEEAKCSHYQKEADECT